MSRGAQAALVALAFLALAFSLTLALDPLSDESINDLNVYRNVAVKAGDGQLPYRDVMFEYPPLAAPVVALPGLLGTSYDSFRLAFAGWMFLFAAAAMVLCATLAARTGGDGQRALLAAALTPLLCGAMIRTHFDLAPVAFLLGALLLLCNGRPRWGLAVLGVAVMVKGFPIVAAPVAIAWLVAAGRRREAVEGALVLVAVMAIVSLAALALSVDGVRDALDYQTGRPAQIESSPATVLRGLDALGLGEATKEASHGSGNLVHPADAAVLALFAAVLLGAVGLVSALVARAGDADPRRLVLASLAAVTAFVALGNVLSPQYLVWVAPLGILAFAWRMDGLAAVVAAAILLTLAEFPAHYFDLEHGEPFWVLLVAARNGLLFLALGLCLRELVGAQLSSRRPAVARSA